MAIILNIDTSTELCSVALSKGDDLLVLLEVQDEKFVHAEKLHLLIQDCFRQAGLKISDLEAVSVSKGPGSYTGLRIGVAAAKGLAYALNIPLISVCTLQALTNGVLKKTNKMLLCPMIDARRMEVYTALFDVQLQELSSVEALIVDENFYANFQDQNILYFGSGAEKCQAILGDNFSYQADMLTSAAFMVELSFKKYQENNFENLALFEPAYLKEFMAGKPKNIFG